MGTWIINNTTLLLFIVFIISATIGYVIQPLMKTKKETEKMMRIQNSYIRYLHFLVHKNNLLNNNIKERDLNDEFTDQELKDLCFKETDIKRIKSSLQ